MKNLILICSLCLCVCVVPDVPGQGKDKPSAESVTYVAGKDKVKATWCRPVGAGPFPAIVVVHGDFGPTAWVKKEAERLAGKGFAALAIDLYRGELPKDIEEAHILERGLPEQRVQTDLR